ncbi:hypothetical protein GS504_03910 [Rhodococcus hoagii]|nr:hypothetical protein [Prescottella equi]NKS56681.1 hypothetical protein [Prescottella equi]NKS68786.1 hypothetical protein [Prescottella equi]
MHTTYLSTEDVATKLQVVTKTVRRLVNVEGLPAPRRQEFPLRRVRGGHLDSRAGSEPNPSKPDHSHRDAIRRLVDVAPELTAAQVDRITAILNGGN